VSRKRILLVGPRVRHVKTGVGAAFELAIEALQNTGHCVVVVNTEWGGAVRSSGSLNLKRILVVATCVFQTWWKLPRSHVVYMPISTSKFGFLRDFLIIHAAALLKARIVVHLHGSGLKPFYKSSSPSMQHAMKKTYSKVDCCIVLGELLRDQFDFVPEWQQKTKVVLNGTPLDESRIPAAHVKKPPHSGEPWRFLFMSNLMPTKGYIELVEASRLLMQQGIENFQVDLCGAFVSTIIENQSKSVQQQERDFLQSIENPSLGNRVVYHGTVSGEAKVDLLEKCHVLVLATYHPWEGQPLSINEALAWATPVISTRHRGIPEQVLDGENGFFVEPQNAASLAACMRRLIQGQTEYESLSQRAQEHYEAHFTNEQHIATLVPLLVASDKHS